MTPDKNVAITASGALASEGLPGSKSFLPAGVGDVHKLGIDPNALIIDGAKPHPVLEQIASDVAAGFPSLRGTSFKGNNLVEILERAAVADNSQGGRQAFQEALTVALRNEGVDGVKVGDNIAMYNTQRVIPKSKEVVPHLSTPENLADAKYTLEEWGHGQTKSAIAKANSLDTEALAVAQRIKALEGTKDELANKVFKEIETAGLFEHPPRVSGVAKEGSTTVDNWTKYPNLEAAMEALPPGTLPTNAIDAMSTVNGKLNNSTRDALTTHFWDDLVDLTPGTPLKDGWADRLGVPRDTPLEDLAKLDPSPSMVEAVSRELDEYAQHLYCP